MLLKFGEYFKFTVLHVNDADPRSLMELLMADMV